MIFRKCTVILLLLISANAYPQGENLFDISPAYIEAFTKAQNAQLSLHYSNSILVEMQPDASRVELMAPDGAWDLSRNTSLSFDVTNVGH